MTYDVIIAGGGIAGAATAAALSQLNYRVLVVEPGLDHSRRLAGELIHPPGVAHLRELGLLACVEKAGSAPVHGFAIFASGPSGSDALAYAEVPGLVNPGLAIEHGLLAEALLKHVEELSNVTVWKEARVTSVDLNEPGSAKARVVRNGTECELQTSLLVAADGRTSAIRRTAGIAHDQLHLSNMVGFALSNKGLPHPGFGHVFCEGPAPVLAYGINDGQARIMFDVPVESHGMEDGSRLKRYVAALPDTLRGDVETVVRTGSPLRAANYSILTQAVVKGRLVCVGDAGGCSHPVTASGLTTCFRDAARLKQAIYEANGDIASALPRYARRRAGPQHARITGAQVLYEVLKGATPDMDLVRCGLLRYWQQSKNGRCATMALLSLHDERMASVIREYLEVCRYALPLIAGHNDKSRAMFGLSMTVLNFIRRSMPFMEEELSLRFEQSDCRRGVSPRVFP